MRQEWNRRVCEKKWGYKKEGLWRPISRGFAAAARCFKFPFREYSLPSLGGF